MNAVYLAKIANAGKAYRLVHLLFWDFYSVSYVKQDILCATAKQPFVHNTSNRMLSLCLMNCKLQLKDFYILQISKEYKITYWETRWTSTW